MPDIGEELHRWWREGVVLREFEFGGEDSTLEGCALRPLDQGFPVKEVILGDGARGYSLRRVVSKSTVLL